MKKQLAVFGCSWSCPVEFNPANNGQIVSPEQTYGYLLSQSMDCILVNLALRGSSISRAFIQLIEYVKSSKIDIAVFQLTSPDRTCFIDDNNIVHDLRNGNRDYLSKGYYKHFHSQSNVEFDLHKNLLSLQSICKTYGIQDYYIRAWHNMNIDKPGVDQSKIYPQSFTQIFDSNGSQNQYLLNCGHPNAAGHALVAKTVHAWITKNH